MNLGYKATIDKQQDLVSLKNKLFSKTAVTILKTILYIVFLFIIISGSMLLGVVYGIIKSAPNVDEVSILPSSYSSTVYDNKNQKMTKLVTTGSNRIRVSLDKVPKYLQWGFIDTEDERFYEHNGIDIQGIGRAAMILLSTQNASEGASTLTQQVLKNNVFTDWTEESTLSSSLKRKIQEQYLALQLEKITDKKTILETYLNTINLGSNTLGVQAASRRYFNKSVDKLTLAEASVIAAITQNPTKYNPINNPKENAARRKRVLDKMLAKGHITQKQYVEALNDNVYKKIQTVNTKITKRNSKSIYSYFVDEVINQVMSDLQTQKGYTYTQAYNAVYSGGLKIYSTQDTGIQKICDDEMSDPDNYPYYTSYSFNWAWTVQNPDGTIDNFDENDIKKYHRVIKGDDDFNLIFSTKAGCDKCIKAYKKHLKKKYYKKGVKKSLGYQQYETVNYTPQPQASFTVMDQYTGYVKAIVGGRGKKTVSLSLDRATDSTRQPGSCFKILSTYAPALDTHGDTLATEIEDSPFKYKNGRKVKNWYSGYRGTATIRTAIKDSMNVCAVKKLTEIGVSTGYDYVCNFGITTLDEKRDVYQPLALGGITRGVTNLEMTAAYASIANLGTYSRPAFYSKVVDSSGNVILDNTTPTTHTAIKSSTAALLTQAMTSVVKDGTGTAAELDDMRCAGKTGTTSSEYDLWFCGYTPYLTASIWTGYDDNKTLAGDQSYHERLWAKIMDAIDKLKHYKNKKFSLGKDVLKYTDGGNSEYFAKGTQPSYYYPVDKSDYDDDDDYDNYKSSGNYDSDSDKKTTKSNSSNDKKKKSNSSAETAAKVDRETERQKKERATEKKKKDDGWISDDDA
ncbi:MAG: PBP1A family penicillin-binding protein [Eubacterium sp.]|nr:PBP1A family penicillin-binding protein [Eubacterium sp.]